MTLPTRTSWVVGPFIQLTQVDSSQQVIYKMTLPTRTSCFRAIHSIDSKVTQVNKSQLKIKLGGQNDLKYLIL
jgi:hypothetical protein